MATVKVMIVFSFTIEPTPYCPIPYFDLHADCSSVSVWKRWYNGDVETRYIDVTPPYSFVGGVCQPFGGIGCGANPKLTMTIVGLESASWCYTGCDHPIMSCWYTEHHYFPPITEKFAWQTVQKRESIGLVEEDQTPSEVAGYWILGVWVRKVRAKHDMILSSDHNNVTEVLKRAIALIKAKAEV